MTIRLEFLSIVIPVPSLRKCPEIGNVERFLREQTEDNPACWHDGELYREGVMNDFELHMAIERWKKLGLRPMRKRNGIQEWNDLCVVDAFSGPTLPCRWLSYDPERATVSFRAGN